MNDYYVYSLIDPRTNSIFYIGKGKGKRMFQHFKEKTDVHSNTEKQSIIKEIINEGFEVISETIAENLSENAAFLLEKILIYRIGRKIFDEGSLTNIVPGGEWNKDKPYFIKESDLPSEEVINESYPEISVVLKKYPKTSIEFRGLTCPFNPLDDKIHVYSDSGKKLNEWDLSYFVNIFGLGHVMDLINVIKYTKEPVYAWGRVWSKTNYLDFDDITRIPYQDFDIINIEFIKKVNISLDLEEDAIIKCDYSNGKNQAEIEIKNRCQEILLEHYYPNGVKKHSTNFYRGKLNGKCLKWYPDGRLKNENEYIDNNSKSIIEYYNSGKTKEIITYNNLGISISHKSWFEHGQLNYERFDTGEAYSYYENGKILRKATRTGDINKGGFVMIIEYFENGVVKKETKNYYKDNLLHGIEKYFYETGELKKEIDYSNGIKNKIIKTYKKG